MNSKGFLLNLIEYSKEEGFSILIPHANFDQPEKLSAAKQFIVTAAASIAFGLVGGLSSGYLDKTNKDELIADLKRMSEYCDFTSIKLSAGPVLLRLAIDADDITNEALLSLAQ